MKPYLWWWAFLLAIFVFVGWATGSIDTGKAAEGYFAATVVGIALVVLIASGFLELRDRARGIGRDENLPFRPPPSIRRLTSSCVFLVICVALAIHESGDWLGLAVALLGVVLFGGRAVMELHRLWRRA